MLENVFKYLLLFLLGCLEVVTAHGPYVYQQPQVVSQPQPVYASYNLHNQPQQGYIYQTPTKQTYPVYNQQQPVYTQPQQPRQVLYNNNQPQYYYQQSGKNQPVYYPQQQPKPQTQPVYYYPGSQPASTSHHSLAPPAPQKPVYQYQYYQPAQVQPTSYAFAQPTSYGYVQPTTYTQPKPTVAYIQPARGQYVYPPQVATPAPMYHVPQVPVTPTPHIHIPPVVTPPPVPHTHVKTQIHAHGSPTNPLPQPHAHVTSVTHAHQPPPVLGTSAGLAQSRGGGEHGGGHDSVRVLSYNLNGLNGGNPQIAPNVFKAIRLANPDILGAQECEGLEQVVAANIGPNYAVAGSANTGHAIIYRTTMFELEGHGFVKLNEQDNFGIRTVEYARFKHILSDRQVDFFNTHLCLCSGDLLLGSARTIIETIVQHRRPGSRIILTGDFNCDDGWENSKPVRYFTGLLGGLPVPPLTLDDTFRTYNGADVDGTTFPGKPGKIDYVMVDKGAVVRNAWIDRNWADHGHASDHWPVGAVVDLRQ